MRFTLLWIFIFTSIAFTQPSEDALFQQGLSAYQKKDYARAQTLFFKQLQSFPRGRLVTAGKLMLAKSYYKLGDYNAVTILCRDFFKRYPESQYLDDMHHLLGNTHFRQGKYVPAIEEWFWVVENGTDVRLKKIAARYIYQTASRYLSEPELQTLQRRYRSGVLNGLLTLLEARQLLEQGRRDRAVELLNKFLQEQPNHIYADQARLLLQFQQKPVSGNPTIVYLKSIFPDEEPVSEAIELGMRYALQEFKERKKAGGVDFVSIPVGESVLNTLQAAQQGVSNNNTLALVGPLDTDQCAAVALFSHYEQIPYVVPTSAAVGFTEISEFAFQLNPDAETKGRFLGNYATREMGLKTLAILAPVSEYGESFVHSFIEAVQANQAEVVTTQWYYEDTQDFTRQFRAIRKKGFFVFYRDSIRQVDSTLSDEAIQKGFREWMDEKFSAKKFGAKVDSTQIPSTGIDGLLIITSPDLIPIIASQFAFHNIQCTLLGNEGWNHLEALQKNKDYLPDLVFISAAYYDPQSWEYRQFVTRFRSRMKTTPELFHMLGYDLMTWMLEKYRPAITRQEFASRLTNPGKYQGIVENIEFREKPRINSHLFVLRFKLGQLLKVK